MSQSDRPTSLKRAPKPAADNNVDPITSTPVEGTPERVPETTPAASPAAPAPKARRGGREITVPLSTRLSEQVIEILDTAVATEGITVRAALEDAIRTRWGKSD